MAMMVYPIWFAVCVILGLTATNTIMLMKIKKHLSIGE